ncbi:MAG: ABC-type transport auxiliary lipoprotein family protein [Pseudomonadota bacterium]
MALKTRFVAAACVGLGACGPIVDLGGQSGPPPRIYDMAPSIAGAPSDAEAKAFVVLVEEPTAESVLDQDRIAVRLDYGEIQYLSGLRLADRPARLIRKVIVEDLGKVNHVTALGRGALDVPSDFRLKLIVRDFQINAATGGPQSSTVTLQALLIDTSGALAASEVFSQAQDAPLVEGEYAIKSLNESLGVVVGQLKTWLLATAQATLENS